MELGNLIILKEKECKCGQMAGNTSDNLKIINRMDLE